MTNPTGLTVNRDKKLCEHCGTYGHEDKRRMVCVKEFEDINNNDDEIEGLYPEGVEQLTPPERKVLDDEIEGLYPTDVEPDKTK
jgi:hypothetical protein